VYVARNPKDVIVSYFHHHKLFVRHTFKGDIQEFAEYFMNNELNYTPFFPHILEGWAKKDHPNVLFLFYEDMKSDLQGEIDKVCKFLGKTLSPEQRSRLLSHLKFDNFAKNAAVNAEDKVTDKTRGSFIRKEIEIFRTVGLGVNCFQILSKSVKFYPYGKTGDWKNHFSGELNERLDAWIKKNLESTDLKFKMELEHQD